MKVEVTRSFSSTNSSFDGGLYVHGKNLSTQEEFSIALGNQSSTSIVLKFGKWDIRVVGWDNDPQVMQGNVLCAHEVIDFKSDAQKATLQVTEAKCNDPALGSTDPVGIYFCGALYDPDAPQNLLSAAQLSESFCTNPLYPKDFQKTDIQGIIYTLHSKLPGGKMTDGLKSECITGNNITSSPLKILPTKMPFTMKVFSDTTCSGTSKIGDYYFPTGLDVSDLSRSELNFDAVFKPGAPGVRMLALAAPLSKRGTTPFLTERPMIKCGPSTGLDSCLTLPPLPTTPTAQDYVVSDFDNTLFIPGPIVPGICIDNTLTGWTSTSTPPLNMRGCHYRDDGLVIRVNATGISPGTDVSFSFGTTPIYTKSARVSAVIHLYRDLQRILGFKQSTSPPLANSLLEGDGWVDSRVQESGIFGEISEFFSPSIVGGIFWDQTCSSVPLEKPITRTLSLNEKGLEQNYSLTLTNPPAVNTPRYFLNSNPRNLTDGQAYHRRVIIRAFKGVMGYQTEMLFDFACDGEDQLNFTNNLRIGRVEEYREDTTATKINIQQRLLLWNTSLLVNSRFENYRFESEKVLTDTNAWRIQRVSTTFTRGEKFPNVSNDDRNIQINDLNYHYDYKEMLPGTSDDTFFEELRSKQYDLSGTDFTYSIHPFFRANGQAPQNLDPGKIFSDKLFPHEKNAVLFRQKETETPISYLPNGKFLHAYQEDSGSELKLKVDRFDGTSYTTSQPYTYANSLPKKIASDLSFDGTKAIVVTSENGSSILKVYFYNGTTMSESTASIASAAQKIRVVVHDNGDHLIAIQGMDDKLYFAIGSFGAIPSNLNLVTSPDISSYQLEELQLAKDDTNKLWLAVIYSYIDGPNKVSKLSHCRVSSIYNTCTLTPLDSFSAATPTTNIIESLSLYNADDGSAITVSYRIKISGIKSEKSFITPSSTINFTVEREQEINATDVFPPILIGRINLTQPIGSTPPLSTNEINVPFVAPAAPGFRMNYMSLEPSKFRSVFTPPGTFLNTK